MDPPPRRGSAPTGLSLALRRRTESPGPEPRGPAVKGAGPRPAPPAPRTASGARQRPPPPPRLARRPRPHPPAAPPCRLLLRPLPSPCPPRLPLGRTSEPPGPERRRRGHRTCSARAAEPAPRLPPPDLLLPPRRVSHDARVPRPATMTASLQDGQSAAGRAAARDSPLAAQVCGAAQGGRRPRPGAGPLAARAGTPAPPDATRGCAANR